MKKMDKEAQFNIHLYLQKMFVVIIMNTFIISPYTLW